MVLLVQIAQRHCIGEQLVERISAGAPHVLTKSDRHRIDRSEFVDDVVSPALPIPAFSDSLQSHCALSNERIPRPTRAGRRGCRSHARIRQPQRGCIDGYQFTAKQFSDPRSLARSGVAHVEKLGKLTAVKAELDASVVVNTEDYEDKGGDDVALADLLMIDGGKPAGKARLGPPDLLEPRARSGGGGEDLGALSMSETVTAPRLTRALPERRGCPAVRARRDR